MSNREKRTRTPSDSPSKQLNCELTNFSERFDTIQTQVTINKRNRSNRFKSNLEGQQIDSKLIENVLFNKSRLREASLDVKAQVRNVSKNTSGEKKSLPNRKKSIVDSSRARVKRSSTEMAKKRSLLKRTSLPITKKIVDKTTVTSTVKRRSLPARKTRGTTVETKGLHDSKEIKKEHFKSKAKGKIRDTSLVAERLRKPSKTSEVNNESLESKTKTINFTTSTENEKETVENNTEETENKSNILQQMAHNFSEVEIPLIETLSTRRSGRPRKSQHKEKSEDVKSLVLKLEEVCKI